MRVYVDSNQNATVHGDYAAWSELRKTCERLGFPTLANHEIVGEPHDIKRIAAYLDLYWNVVRRIPIRAAWIKLAKLANCKVVRA